MIKDGDPLEDFFLLHKSAYLARMQGK